MSITIATLDDALSRHCSSWPFRDSEEEEDTWNLWLARLTGADIPVLLEAAIQQIERLYGFAFDFHDPWLLSLLTCLEHAGYKDAETYLHHAERFRQNRHRAIFLATAGALFSDAAIDWLVNLQREGTLNEQELRLVVDSLQASGTEYGLAGLDRVLSMIPAESFEFDPFLRDARTGAAHRNRQ